MKTFTEIQQFRQWWLWVIILLMPLVIIFLIYFDENKSTTEMIIPLVIFLPFIWFFYALKLKTLVDDKGISLTFKPFLLNHKFIPFEEIEDIKKIKYNPILECGGWGLRWYKNGRAYNVSGNIGIEIKLKSGKIILIGTTKADEFMNFIKYKVSLHC